MENTMKYLSNYVEAKQSALFAKTGTYFAFSQKQYDEGKKEGINYVSLGAGIICPKENFTELTEGLETIQQAGMAQDLAENGKDAIILRELHNHESFYCGDIEDTVYALEDYGITRTEIIAVYDRVAPTIDY
jgi:hypothetical protein